MARRPLKSRTSVSATSRRVPAVVYWSNVDYRRRRLSRQIFANKRGKKKIIITFSRDDFTGRRYTLPFIVTADVIRRRRVYAQTRCCRALYIIRLVCSADVRFVIIRRGHNTRGPSRTFFIFYYYY